MEPASKYKRVAKERRADPPKEKKRRTEVRIKNTQTEPLALTIMLKINLSV